MIEERVVTKETISRQHLNQLVPGGLRGLYNSLKFKKYYLPVYESKAISVNYLLGLMTGKFYSVMITDVKKKIIYREPSAIQLVEDLAKKLTTKSWGFSVDNPPDYFWLVDVTAIVCPEHSMFSPLEPPSDTVEVEIQKE